MALSYGRLRSSRNNPLFDAARLAELVPKLVAQVRRNTSPPKTPLVPATFLQMGGGVYIFFSQGMGRMDRVRQAAGAALSKLASAEPDLLSTLPEAPILLKALQQYLAR